MLQILVFVMLVCGDSAMNQQAKRSFPVGPMIIPPLNIDATGVYTIATEKCCLGQVSPANRYSKCCGKNAYNPTKQLCCQNEVKPLVSGYACCGTGTFDTDKELCCDGMNVVVSPGVIDSQTRCCGNQTYNMKEQLCCNYNGQMKIIDSTIPNAACCGDKAMNIKTEICCSDFKADPMTYTVHLRTSANAMCCHTEVFNTQTHGCCNGNVYDLNNQTCCFAKYPYKLIPVSKRGEQCCGTSEKIYSIETELCCGNEIAKKDNGKMRCCGNKTYNIDNSICCFANAALNIIQKESPGQNGCCGGKPFNYHNQSCCTDYKNENTVYDPKDSTCCNGKVYSGKGMCCTAENGTQEFQETSGYSYSCCGTKAYNYLSQLCCGNRVFDKTANNTACCGDQSYNDKTQTCCTGFDYSTNTIISKVIDENRFGKYCCGFKLISYSGQSCCGDREFDNKNQTCCGNKLFSNKGEGLNSCCYPYTTDNRPYPVCQIPL